jgi:hypothetical protein
MIRMSVLTQQVSHLLLIRTNLGYGAVLTAACARQGCSATDYCCYYYDYLPIICQRESVNLTVNFKQNMPSSKLEEMKMNQNVLYAKLSCLKQKKKKKRQL